MYHSAVHYITNIPASSWYHAAAFLLTGFGAQYSVQLVKIITKNKYGKTTLRFLNGTFSTLYVAAGAVVAGGLSLGNVTITSAAIASFSAVIYRIHNSFLYSSGEKLVTDALSETPTGVVVPTEPIPVEPSQFASKEPEAPLV